MKKEEREEPRDLEPEGAEEDVEEHDDDDDDDEVENLEGPWYRFPPMRNALISGALLLVG